MSRKTIAKISGIACGIVGFLNTAHGATFNVSWDGGATGSYNTAVNWSTNTVPLNVEPLNDFFNVTINRAGGTNVTGNLTQIEILNLSIGANAGNQLTLADNCTFNLIGTASFGPSTATNAGTIQLGATAAAASQFRFLGSTNALSGGGTISMIGANTNFFSSGTLTSDNTIIGFGGISTNFAMVNNGTVTASGGSLTVDAGATGGFDNNLLMQAVAAGTLVLSGAGGGSFANGGGTIANNGGRVNLIDGATIAGGNITTQNLAGTSIFFVPGGESAGLSGVTSAADVNVGVNSTLSLANSITNNGRIRTNSAAGIATYDLGTGTVTLNGTGSLSLAAIASSAGQIVGVGTLINGASHSIVGAGTIGTGSLQFINNGLINANLAGQAIVLRPEGAGFGFTNNGTVRASTGEIRLVNLSQFQMANAGTFDVQSGGTLTLDSGGSALVLAINGGTFNIAAGGMMRSVNSTGLLAIQNNVRINNAGTILVDDALWSIDNVQIANTGNIDITADGGFDVDAPSLILSGSGTVNLVPGAVIRGAGSFNNIGNLVRGAGEIGLNETRIINAGTISADVNGATLTIDGGATFTNNGTVQTVNGGLIRIVDTFIDNSSGQLHANAGNINLTNNTTISGGTLNSGTSLFFVPGGSTATLSNLTNNATVSISAAAVGTLALSGVITNNRDIRVAGTAVVNIPVGTTTLGGSGSLSLSNSGTNSNVLGSGTLVNGASHRIVGRGNIGNNTLALRNSGTISADSNGERIVIDPGAGNLINTGAMQATNNAVLELSGAGVGTVVNSGVIQVVGSGTMELTNAIVIAGGSLSENSLLSRFQVRSADSATIRDIALAAPATDVFTGTTGTLTLGGTINNNGRIHYIGNAHGNTVSGTTTLNGNGEVNLSTAGTTATFTINGLLVNESNAIRGHGSIGGGNMINGAAGVISADNASETLRLIPGSFSTYENRGLMSAAGGGAFVLESGFFGGGFSNTGAGTMLADDASMLRLQSSGVRGGTLSTAGSGTIDLNSASLLDTTVNGRVVHDEGDLTFGSLVTSNGSITSVTNGNDLILSQAVATTFVNNGSMSINTGTFISTKIVGGGSLANNGTITGTFQFDPDGTGSISVINSGLMETSGASSKITFDANSSGPAVTVSNSGTIRANAGGSIEFPTNVLVTGNGTADVRATGALVSSGSVTFGQTVVDGDAIIVNAAALGRTSGSGTLMVGFPPFFGSTPVGQATVTHARVATVTVLNESSITTTVGGGTLGTSRVSSLSFINTGTGGLIGKWNLTNHDLVVDYTVASPFASILTAVQTGFAGGAWTGNGITSSAAQTAAATTDKTGLAIVEAGELFPSFPRDFSGQSIDSTTVLVKYTLLGDTNLDSVVNITDFAALAANFNTGGRWNRGDFNYDSLINIADFALLASNFNKSLSADLPRGTSVPEPTVAAIGLAALVAFQRSRRMK